ncbi:unnamed protein product [Gongylonema pulchrum]|uniref:Pectate lyase n=1 Tax=Gongylonema pulchrum TaxID=637853 RepID=A0A183ETN9_9BILA|nr:unnamed protein product [Gongylonema pulchrum]
MATVILPDVENGLHMWGCTRRNIYADNIISQNIYADNIIFTANSIKEVIKKYCEAKPPGHNKRRGDPYFFQCTSKNQNRLREIKRRWTRILPIQQLVVSASQHCKETFYGGFDKRKVDGQDGIWQSQCLWPNTMKQIEEMQGMWCILQTLSQAESNPGKVD